MQVDKDTVGSYDKNIDYFLERFSLTPARVEDIEHGISLCETGSDGLRVVEIGCGSGRDAKEIVSRVAWYQGFDPSSKLLEKAEEAVPEGNFMLSSALDYIWPKNLDIVVAFASLVHCSKEDLKEVFERVAGALKQGGIFYVNFRLADEYHLEIDTLGGGRRKYYYYDDKTLAELASGLFEKVFEERPHVVGLDWITLGFRR